MSGNGNGAPEGDGPGAEWGDAPGMGFCLLGLGFGGGLLSLGLEEGLDFGGGGGKCLGSPAAGSFWSDGALLLLFPDSQRDFRWEEEDDEGLFDEPLG